MERVKIVMIDIDGTVTCPNGKITNIFSALSDYLGFYDKHKKYYEEISERLKNDPSLDLPKEYLFSNEFFGEKLREYNLTEELFNKISENVELRRGLKESYEYLKKKGYEVFVVSDSIRNYVSKIEEKYGKFYDVAFVRFFFVFDENGNFVEMKETFGGKPKDRVIEDYLRNHYPNHKYDIYAVHIGDSLIDLRFARYPWIKKLYLIRDFDFSIPLQHLSKPIEIIVRPKDFREVAYLIPKDEKLLQSIST